MSDEIKYFANKFKLPMSEVEKISKEVKNEFPDDKMMYELHLIRALIQKKKVKKFCLSS